MAACASRPCSVHCDVYVPVAADRACSQWQSAICALTQAGYWKASWPKSAIQDCQVEALAAVDAADTPPLDTLSMQRFPPSEAHPPKDKNKMSELNKIEKIKYNLEAEFNNAKIPNKFNKLEPINLEVNENLQYEKNDDFVKALLDPGNSLLENITNLL